VNTTRAASPSRTATLRPITKEPSGKPCSKRRELQRQRVWRRPRPDVHRPAALDRELDQRLSEPVEQVEPLERRVEPESARSRLAGALELIDRLTPEPGCGDRVREHAAVGAGSSGRHQLVALTIADRNQALGRSDERAVDAEPIHRREQLVEVEARRLGSAQS